MNGKGIFQGLAGAYPRALYRAAGFGDEDFHPTPEVIAASTELIAKANRFDGPALLGTCDKIIPAMITDGRFSGATRGPCIGHISPEAAANGPLAIVQDEDEIEIDIPERRLELCLSQVEISRRLENLLPRQEKPASGFLSLYRRLVSQADEVAILRWQE
jgi:dihydroxyacid dehydratase/phosphogluconate dehydratase